MSKLKIILIDVGWGDSIFLESTYSDQRGNEKHSYALIDSNDTVNYKSSLIFLRKYFQRKFGTSKINKPLFDWVMLSHAHLDHGEGLKEIMQTFGTKRFFYPKSKNNTCLAHLQNYVNRVRYADGSTIIHQAIDDQSIIPAFGNASVNILWPPKNYHKNNTNENNNSIVFSLTQDNQSCIFTGDAEEEVWDKIKHNIPQDTVFLKIPHHGSRNGSIDNNDELAWSTPNTISAFIGISTHNRPYNHPDDDVLDKLDDNDYVYARTDKNYHIEITIDASGRKTKYSKEF
ncbi:hypothetical protein DMA11_07855 [Marinilabiliaceae bacterium JC017]|nr:hypothetical protein DMA11_07855 [Marinilabiliaceae bacterium JC017]